MTRMTKLTTLGLLAAFAGASIAPAMANQQSDKNNARNLALGGAAIAAYGLFSHNAAATVLGAAGAAIAGSQYENDRQIQSQDNGRYYYRNYGGGYDRNGYNHDGYNRDGYNHDGYNHDGFNRDGYDGDGFNRDGYNRDGRNRDGNNRNGDGQNYDNRNFGNRNGGDQSYGSQSYNSQGYGSRNSDGQNRGWNNGNRYGNRGNR